MHLSLDCGKPCIFAVNITPVVVSLKVTIPSIFGYFVEPFICFDPVGGDCTNFVSQCIYAGCGQMNYNGDMGWYYINGTNVNNTLIAAHTYTNKEVVL